jgi:integrase
MVPLVLEAARGRGEHDLLFPGPRGGYISSGNLSRALNWESVRDSIKTFPPDEEPLHFHDLRHTAAVMLFRAGVSAPDVQAVMGHSTLAVTQLYANTRHDAARRGAAALSDLWRDKSNTQLGGGERPSESRTDLGI